MAYPFATIQTEVRNNVNDASAVVTQPIDNAVNYLSNFFSLKKIATGNTTAGQDYITKPTNSLEVERLTVNLVQYDKIRFEDMEDAEDNELEKFYEYNDQIKLLPTPTAVVAYKAWYKCGFTPMAGAGSTDVPDRLVPLLITCATWFYWSLMVSKVATARENFPDMTPDEAQKIADTWRKQFVQLLKLTKKDKSSL